MSLLSPSQMAVFSAAVARRSSGAIRLPRLAVPAEEAKAFWHDLLEAFPGQGEPERPLSQFERVSLGRQARIQSDGAVSINAPIIGRTQGLVLWRIAERVGHWSRRYALEPRWRRPARIAFAGLAASQLAACVGLFGGNVKGSWNCSAPGGSCAPSTLIDDQALAAIQNARPMSPAGPYIEPRRPPNRSVVASRLSQAQQTLLADNGLVHRDRRVMKVVFPSYVDGMGNVHEPRIVHTLVDGGGWMEMSLGEANAGAQALARSEQPARAVPGPDAPATVEANTQTSDIRSRRTAAQSAGAGLAASANPSPSAAVVGSAPAAPTTGLAQSTSAGPPDPAVVAAVRARGNAQATSGTASPIDAIRAEVQARLAATAKAPPNAGTTPPSGLLSPSSVPTGPGSGTTSPAPDSGKSAVPQTAAQPSRPAPPANPPAAMPGTIEE